MNSRSRSKAKADASVPSVAAGPVTILEQAQGICLQDRQYHYGSPMANHTVTADLYNAYIAGRLAKGQSFVGPEEVCILNILQKIARTVHGGYRRDSLVDIAGYAFNIELIQNARAEQDRFGES